MPQRHETARLGKQQKQDAIQDGQRLLPQRRNRLTSSAREGLEQCFERFKNAGTQSPANLDAVMARERDGAVERGRVPAEGAGRGDRPQHRLRLGLESKQRKIELDVVTRPRSPCIDKAKDPATLVLLGQEGQTDAEVRAAATIGPAVQAAYTVAKIEKGGDLNALVGALQIESQRAISGDTGRMEEMLVTQAHTLDLIFNN